MITYEQLETYLDHVGGDLDEVFEYHIIDGMSDDARGVLRAAYYDYIQQLKELLNAFPETDEENFLDFCGDLRFSVDDPEARKAFAGLIDDWLGEIEYVLENSGWSDLWRDILSFDFSWLKKDAWSAIGCWEKRKCVSLIEKDSAEISIRVCDEHLSQ